MDISGHKYLCYYCSELPFDKVYHNKSSKLGKSHYSYAVNTSVYEEVALSKAKNK